MLELFLSALRNLGRKGFRSAITICGIMIGVASVIVIGSIGSGASMTVDKQLDGLGINGLDISRQRDNIYDFGATMSDKDLTVCLGVKGVKSAMPLIMQAGDAVLHGYQKDTVFWGVGSNARSMISLTISHGRMFSKSQVASHARVCLVDDTFAKEIYKRTNITGKQISIYMGSDYVDFTICGVVESSGSLLYNLVGSYIPTFVYLPYTTVEDLRNRSGFDDIMVKSADNGNQDRIGAQIIADLKKQNGGNTYTATNMLRQRQSISDVLDIITLVISAVGAISLIVAGLGTMTIMLVSVHERTREIGIKKAIGAKKGLILLEFLFEALFISILGGLSGVLLGIFLSYICMTVMHIAFCVSIRSILLSTGFALMTGTIFGVYPAYKAANLKPVDALREE
jgi:ABC-type transport system, involved in lipoprotein release, permease component